MSKSTVEEIRERFDNDVERFSNLETGQTATVDAPLILDRIAEAARRTNPDATHVLDVGCGAGNYTLKLLGRLPNLSATLVDLSLPMLERAQERVSAQTSGAVVTRQADIRDAELGEEQFDVILAAMVLHHLRGRDEWEAVFAKLHRSLRPGGSLWIADHVEHEIGPVQEMMQDKWGEYLSGFKGDDYRDHVFAYVAQEDTPRPLLFQTDMMRRAGFARIDVLHMNTLFAAFGGIK